MQTFRMTHAIAACGFALASSASIALAQTGIGSDTSARGGARATPGVVQFGLEGGASISNFVGNDRPDMKNRTGAYGGLTMIIQPNASALGFQTGVLYVEKGGKSNSDPSRFGGGINFRYIEVPVLLRVGVPMSVFGVSPTVMAGASLGYRIGCKVETRLAGVNTKTDCDDAYADGADDGFDTKRFDGGLSVGIEIPVALGESFVLFPSVRYSRSLTNVVNGSDNNVKNSNVLIGVGFRFR